MLTKTRIFVFFVILTFFASGGYYFGQVTTAKQFEKKINDLQYVILSNNRTSEKGPGDSLRNVTNNVKVIKAIIFDVGGVFNEGSPDFIQAFKKHGIELKEDLWKNAKCKELILKFCTGKYGNTREAAQSFAQELCAQASIGRKIDFEQFKLAWNAVIIRLHYELLDKLILLQQQGYRLFVLSDTNLLHREHLEELYRIKHPDKSFRELFERCYFSHETGKYKGFGDAQADQAWLQILTENGLKAEECLFIDDKLENVKKAERLGFWGLHYPAGSTSFIVFQKLDELNKQKITIKSNDF